MWSEQDLTEEEGLLQVVLAEQVRQIWRSRVDKNVVLLIIIYLMKMINHLLIIKESGLISNNLSFR